MRDTGRSVVSLFRLLEVWVPHPFAKQKGGIENVMRPPGWESLHPTLFQRKEKDGAPTFKLILDKRVGHPPHP